jgi:hypothetical protein
MFLTIETVVGEFRTEAGRRTDAQLAGRGYPQRAGRLNGV